MKFDVEDLLSEAIKAHAAGQLKQALTSYRHILEYDPNNADVNHNLGVLYVQSKKLQESLIFFERALKVAPESSQFWISYVDALLKLDDVKIAEQTLVAGRNVGVKPNQLSMLYCRIGDYWTDNDDLYSSFKSFKNAIDIDPNCLDALYKMSLISHRQGQVDTAIEYIQEFIRLSKSSSDAYNLYGILSRARGDYEAAVENFNAALKLSPNNAPAINNLGLIYNDCGEHERAESYFRRAIDADPSDAKSFSNLASTLKKQNKYDEAIMCCKDALKLDPQFYEALVNMASSLWEKKESDQAIAIFDRAVQAIDKKIELQTTEGLEVQWLVDFGDIRYQRGELSQAIKLYERATVIDSKFIAPRERLGKLLHRKKQYAAALALLEAMPDQDSVAKSLECLYQLNRLDEFNKSLREITERDSINIGVAAISASSSQQKGNNDAYPFCPQPLENIYLSNLKTTHRNSAKFIGSLLSEISDLENIWEPVGQSIKCGYQTQGNIFDAATPYLCELEKIIQKELGLFYQRFKSKKCSMITDWPKDNSYINGWHVRLLKGGHHIAHVHPSGWVSGVIYLKTEQLQSKKSGAIEFLTVPGADFKGGNNFPHRIHNPSDGDILLFPSSLYHRTTPIVEDVERRVVAFDLTPNMAAVENMG